MSVALARTAVVSGFQTFTTPVSEIDLNAANDGHGDAVRKVKRSRLLRSFQQSLPETMMIMPFWRP